MTRRVLDGVIFSLFEAEVRHVEERGAALRAEARARIRKAVEIEHNPDVA